MLSGMFGFASLGLIWLGLAWIGPGPAACDTQQAEPVIKL